MPWRDIPERYGPWQTCWDRFTRWERDGTWRHILQTLQAHADAEGDIAWVREAPRRDGAALDSSYVKAHRSAAGARRQAAAGEKRGM